MTVLDGGTPGGGRAGGVLEGGTRAVPETRPLGGGHDLGCGTRTPNVARVYDCFLGGMSFPPYDGHRT